MNEKDLSKKRWPGGFSKEAARRWEGCARGVWRGQSVGPDCRQWRNPPVSA